MMEHDNQLINHLLLIFIGISSLRNFILEYSLLHGIRKISTIIIYQ